MRFRREERAARIFRAIRVGWRGMAFHHPGLPIGRTGDAIFSTPFGKRRGPFPLAPLYSRVTFESEKKFEIANEEAPRALE